jgi:hypothetical protein
LAINEEKILLRVNNATTVLLAGHSTFDYLKAAVAGLQGFRGILFKGEVTPSS